jgi:hypothetical protein
MRANATLKFFLDPAGIMGSDAPSDSAQGVSCLVFQRLPTRDRIPADICNSGESTKLMLEPMPSLSSKENHAGRFARILLRVIGVAPARECLEVDVCLYYASSSGRPPAPARSCGRTLSTLNFAARSRIELSKSSSAGGSPLIHRKGLILATTKARR